MDRQNCSEGSFFVFVCSQLMVRRYLALIGNLPRDDCLIKTLISQSAGHFARMYQPEKHNDLNCLKIKLFEIVHNIYSTNKPRNFFPLYVCNNRAIAFRKDKWNSNHNCTLMTVAFDFHNWYIQTGFTLFLFLSSELPPAITLSFSCSMYKKWNMLERKNIWYLSTKFNNYFSNAW